MAYLKKFLAFCGVIWQNTIAYRIESLIWLFLEAFPPLVMLSLWQSLARTGSISTAQMQYLSLYYVIVLVIARTTGNHYEEWMIDMIQDGTISNALIKPYPYRLFLLANEAMWRIAGFVYTLPMLLMLSPLFFASISRLHLTGLNVCLFLGVLVIAFAQRFFISWLIAMFGFWSEEARALTHFKWMLDGLFGGSWLPLAFFPIWFQGAVRWTPFFAWYNLPLGIILQTMPLHVVIQNTIIAVTWLVVLIVIGQILWRKAIRKYSASGG